MNHVCCEVIQHNTKVNHIASNYSDYMDSMEKKLTSKQTSLCVIKNYKGKKFIVKPGHIVHVFLHLSKPTMKQTAFFIP